MNHNLHRYHKAYTKTSWKKIGLIWTSEEEFEEIYQRVISSTKCELCKKPYKSNNDRQMDHEHCIDDKWGWFRNVLCRSCNGLRSDRKQTNNTSGYIGIIKKLDKTCRQGFRWRFQAYINGKQITIKSSVDYDYLKKFAIQWKIDNNYHT